LIRFSDGFADFATQELYDLIVCFVNLVFRAKISCLFVCVPVRRNLVCFCVSLCEEIVCLCACVFLGVCGEFSPSSKQHQQLWKIAEDDGWMCIWMLHSSLSQITSSSPLEILSLSLL
jgi:hypothetical protein